MDGGGWCLVIVSESVVGGRGLHPSILMVNDMIFKVDLIGSQQNDEAEKLQLIFSSFSSPSL